MAMNDYLISIFMPVYNGSNYLEKSIKSIINQTFKNFELLCVDDSSTDNSYEIIKKFAVMDPRVRVYNKPNGGNVPKSWNYIKSEFNGNGIMYMSQDDLMSTDNLEKLYKKYKETDADAVFPDMEFYNEGKKNNRRLIGVDGDREAIISGKKAVILNLNLKIPGCPLWQSHLFEGILFPEDTFNSDEFITRKLLLKANKVAFCDGVFYYRQDNNNAITKTFDLKNYYALNTNLLDYNLLKLNKFKEKEIASYCWSIHHMYLEIYKKFNKNYGIKNLEEKEAVEIFLKEFYILIDKPTILILLNYRTGIKKIKVLILYSIFYNFKILKSCLKFMQILDFYRSIKN